MRYRSLILCVVSFISGVFVALALVTFVRDKSRVVATINSVPIPRSAFVNRMTRVCGEDTLAMLTDEAVVRQEVKRQSISVSSKEIQWKMKGFRASFSNEMKFQDWKNKHHLSQGDLKAQAEIDVGLDKLVGKTLDEQELKKYYDNAKTNFRAKDGKLLTFEDAKPQVVSIFVQERKKEFLEKLRGSAKVRRFFITPPLRVE